MNIYEYFNSKDIGEYCQSIDYKFSSIETAYIVWYSDHHTLAEKHKAWQEIIDTMPDEQFHPYWDLEGYTLHSFLKTYMQLQKEYIDDFYKTKERCVYTYALNYKYNDIFHPENIFYSNYEACIKALKEYVLDDDKHKEISHINITRHYLYSTPTSIYDAKEGEVIILNSQLEPQDIEPTYCDDPEDELRLISTGGGFYEMWIAIPVPFKKGDIVTVKHTRENLNGKCRPFILEKVPWQRKNASNDNINDNREYWLDYGVDWTDMDLCAWFQDNNGELYWDHQYCYLDLEYYRDEFVGTENFLVAVSNCMQGKISIEELLRSHSIILMENHAEKMRKYFYHNEKALNDCGIEYKDVFNKK